MQTTDHNADKVFAIVMLLVMAVVLTRAGLAGANMAENFAKMGNDDVMRLISVRNWLGGQGWFDTVEYRMMPPDGVLMHWSRYLDAAIAAILIPLSWVFPVDTAEMLAVTIWPTLLMVLMIILIGFGTRRIFGSIAACFAILCTMLWPLTFDFYFSAGRIDHHNVQVVMMVLMTLAIVWPYRPDAAGVVAGLAAGFSLAIGLESLPYILVLGVLLMLRTSFDVTPMARRLLVVFCLVLAGSSVVFWLGQTPQSGLLRPVCDQLSTPVLSLIGIAGIASVTPILMGLKRPIVRLGASVVLTAAGCVIAWPLLGPCAAGPYALLPQAVQDIISSYITEGQPALVFARNRPLQYNAMMTPVVGAVVLTAVFWWYDRRRPDADPVRRDAIGQLLLLSIVGILASFSQIRLLVMTAAAVPLLAGYGLARLLQAYRLHRSAGAAVGLLASSILILAPFLAEAPLEQAMRTQPGARTSSEGNCRDYASMSALNTLPPGVFLTPMNLGPLMILATHHDGLSGPYHRSPAAFSNGLLPFQMPEAEMVNHVRQTGATHLMLCRGSRYGDSFATMLSGGAQADWLRMVAVRAGDIMVFEILPEGGA